MHVYNEGDTKVKCTEPEDSLSKSVIDGYDTNVLLLFSGFLWYFAICYFKYLLACCEISCFK